MGSDEEEEEEAALSDFEEDDLEAAPVVLPTVDYTSVTDSLKAALAALEVEKQARKTAESAKAESDSSLLKIKAYVSDGFKQKDGALRIKDDTIRQLEEVIKQRDETVKLREEIGRQKDEDIARLKDEISRLPTRLEIESVARMLVTQADKITAMVSSKSFAGGLPRSSMYTGLSAIAYGFGKRMEEVVDEVIRQRDDAVKRRDEIRMLMEQRNLNIAIEVSQLEASITQLKEEVGMKAAEVERCQKFATAKNGRIAELEHAMAEEVGALKQETGLARKKAEDAEEKLKNFNAEIGAISGATSRARELLQGFCELSYVDHKVPAGQSTPTVNLDDKRSIDSFWADVKALADLASSSAIAWKENNQGWEIERRDLHLTIEHLREEKRHLDELLKKTMAEMQSPSEDSSRGSLQGQDRTEIFPADELTLITDISDDLPALQQSSKPSGTANGFEHDTIKTFRNVLADCEKERNEALAKIFSMEVEMQDLKEKLEISATAARENAEKLDSQLIARDKLLSIKTAQLAELEDATKEHIEGLTGELLAAEEEIARWKEAAKDEAAAGEAMQDEVEKRSDEIAVLSDRVAKMKVLIEEANSKLWSKEEMAMAATAARIAAERSLQIADERAADLRQRLEELSSQLEDYEQRGDYWVGGYFDLCWPWLCGRRRPGVYRSERGTQGSAEMEELMEPLV